MGGEVGGQGRATEAGVVEGWRELRFSVLLKDTLAGWVLADTCAPLHLFNVYASKG